MKVVEYRSFMLRTDRCDGGETEEKVELRGLKNNVNLKEQILKAFANDAKPTDLRFDLGDGRIAIVLEFHCDYDSQRISWTQGKALICETDFICD